MKGSDSSSRGTSSDYLPGQTRAYHRQMSRVPMESIHEVSLLDQATKAINRSKEEYRAGVKEYTWYDWLSYFIPCFRWLRTYNIKGWLLWDIMAGLSVGAMVIPQGMSYANLAGLPQVYG